MYVQYVCTVYICLFSKQKFPLSNPHCMEMLAQSELQPIGLYMTIGPTVYSFIFHNKLKKHCKSMYVGKNISL